MKKLFYLLLCMPLAFASCDKLFEDGNEPAKKSYVLTLTSEATLNFGAEGGEGVITFALNEATREGSAPQVEATCEAQWVSNLKVAETITFAVAENDGEARETKIVVKYGEQSFEVAVKQEAKGEDPKPEYAMNIKLAAAMRIPSAELELPNNIFALAFIDDAENVELGVVLVGAEEDTILKAGNYASNNETLLAEECEMYIYEPEGEYAFTEGLAVVAVEEDVYTFDIELADAEGAIYHFSYSGVVLDMEPAETPEATTFNPVKVEAYRAGSWDLGNFELDLYIDEVNYHSLDMMDYVNPNNAYLSAGQYTMDNGGITSWSNFLWNINTGEGAYIVDADITLTHNANGTTTIEGYFESEYGNRLDINWTGFVKGFDFGGAEELEDIVFEAKYFSGEYSAPEYISTHNYWISLTDAAGSTTANATYFYFDLYADSIDEAHTIPNGVYTYDTYDTYAAFTCASYYTYGYTTDADGVPSWYNFTSGTITVTDNKLEAVMTLEDGRTATITYEGNLSLSALGEGTTYSTLTSDLVLNENGFFCVAECYGDYYTADTDNWYVTIYEDIETENGKTLILDLLTANTADSWAQEYKPWATNNFINTFVPGDIVNDYLAGCWYTDIDYAAGSGNMAPIVDGTINVTFNEDGTKTFTFDCVDDAGHKITGSVTTEPEATTFATQSKGEKKASIKRPTMKSLAIRK